ncbi:NADP-dependent oxidoreductase domain-containing protein [Pelagophyceae sp. CCMP2097]|nr:NADP-dependent oxidoreductase domain-containing protein [Pelagophyceae sp. CCMP2097]|mmetsp:Transcript_6648/g.21496  ORF Transcript_6648/g.21496 Transcript_6648/m.21496 type:complete len:334 (+) Transcript_6648:75-1076(+)
MPAASAELSPTLRLSDGVEMPRIGLGTAHLLCAEVLRAIQAGARHLDCARVYGNEAAVGEAMRLSGLQRGEFFVTTKVWCDSLRPNDVLESCEASLADLKVDYVDCILIHWPMAWKPGTMLVADGDLAETWLAISNLVESGKARTAGVSNFDEAQLEPLLKLSRPPTVNQIELHPHCQQSELVSWCQRRNVVVVAWGPLAKGTALKDDRILWATAQMHACSLHRVSLRWNLQRDVVVIPKSTSHAHVSENLAALIGPKLSADEMQLIRRNCDTGRKRFPDLIGIWPSTARPAAKLFGFLLQKVLALLFKVLPAIDLPAISRRIHEREEARQAT